MNISNNNSNILQALWVAVGSFASFGVTIITSMVLSRYFSKADYGTYKQVMYIYTTLLTVFTLGLPQAYGYFLPRVGLERGWDVVNKITSIFYIAGIIFSSLLFFFSSFIASLLNNPDLGDAIKWFSPVPFFLLPTMGIESIFSTYRKTYISSIFVIFSRILVVCCVVIPTILTNGTYKIAIIGFVFSSFLTFLIAIYLKGFPYRNIEKRQSNISYCDIMRFSFPLVYGGIAGMLIHSADQFFISRYFGSVIFAEFSNGAMELPFVGMIIGSCTTVLYPMFSRMSGENQDPQFTIFPIWKSVFSKTVMLIYPMVVFCWVFAKEIMIVLYGEPYAISGIYFQIKLVANLFTLIAFAPVVLSIGKTKYYANVHMYNAIILIILEYISIYFFSSPIAITVISVICQIAKIFALLFLIASYFKVSIIQLFPKRLMLKILIPSFSFLFLIKEILVFLLESPVLIIIVGLIAYLITYSIYSYFTKIDYIKLVKPIFAK